MDGASFYGTTGVGPDLFENSQNAIRAMIDHLVETHDLSARTPTCCAASPWT